MALVNYQARKSPSYYTSNYYYTNIRLTASIPGQPVWIYTRQEKTGWQWHQLDHMRTICTSFQTDNHTNNRITQFLQAGCSSSNT